MIAFFPSFLSKKRGISPVLAVVLLILLTIVAVAFVWALVSGWLTTMGDQIANETDNLP